MSNVLRFPTPLERHMTPETQEAADRLFAPPPTDEEWLDAHQDDPCDPAEAPFWEDVPQGNPNRPVTIRVVIPDPPKPNAVAVAIAWGIVVFVIVTLVVSI